MQEAAARNGAEKRMGSKLSGRYSPYHYLLAAEPPTNAGYHPTKEMFEDVVILSRLLVHLMNQLQRSDDIRLARMVDEVKDRYLRAVDAATTKYEAGT